MAAAIKAINAKIRSNKVLDYVFSTRMYTISFVDLNRWTSQIGMCFMSRLNRLN